MTTPTLFQTYAFDHTGELPANKIVERHTLSVENRREFNIIVPRCAPFFAESVTLRKVETDEVLTPYRHYTTAGSFNRLMPFVKQGLRLSSTILFLDNTIQGTIEVTYQTLGGDYLLDEATVLQTLKDASLNPIMMDWESVLNKPLTYPIVSHEHNLDQLQNYNGVITELGKISNHLLAIGYEREGTSPSYFELIQHLLRHQSQIETLITQQAQLALAQKETVEGQYAEMTMTLQIQREALDREIATSLAEITQKLQEVRTELETPIRQFKEEQRTFMVESEAKLQALSSELKTSVAEKVAEDTVEQNKRFGAQDTLIATIENRLTNVIGPELAAATAALAGVEGKIAEKFEAEAEGFLSKSGDSMTGPLTIPSIMTKIVESEGSQLHQGANQAITVRVGYPVDAHLKDVLENKDYLVLTTTQQGMYLNKDIHIADNAITFGQEPGESFGQGVSQVYTDNEGDFFFSKHAGRQTKQNAVLHVGDVQVSSIIRLTNAVMTEGGEMRGPLGLITADTTQSDGDILQKKENSYSGFYGHGATLSSGLELPQLEIFVAHPSSKINNRAYGRGIGFTYGGAESGVTEGYLTAYDKDGRFQKRQRILTDSDISNDIATSNTNAVPSMALMQEVVLKDAPELDLPLTVKASGDTGVILHSETAALGMGVQWRTAGRQPHQTNGHALLGHVVTRTDRYASNMAFYLSPHSQENESTQTYALPEKTIEFKNDGDIWTKKWGFVGEHFATKSYLDERITSVSETLETRLHEEREKDRQILNLTLKVNNAETSTFILLSESPDGNQQPNTIAFVEKRPEKKALTIGGMSVKSNYTSPSEFQLQLKSPTDQQPRNVLTVDSNGAIMTRRYGKLEEHFLPKDALDEFKSQFNYFFDKYNAFDAKTGTTGWMRFHRDVYMQWSSAVPGLHERAAGKSLRRFTFSIPFKHGCWSLQFTPIGEPVGDLTLVEVTKYGFVIQSQSGRRPLINYLAIGE